MKNLFLLIFAFLLFSSILFAQTNKKPSSRTRSAKTGQYVTKNYGDKHPSTTVRENSNPQGTGRKRRR